MKKLVIFTGAGISAESGLGTFRGDDGLWEKVSLEEVATPEGWERDKEKVLDFYNERKKDCLKAEPNLAHRELVKLEEKFDVTVVTQNIDDLHERGGSSKVIHIHGEILKSRSTLNPNLIYDCHRDIKLGDVAEDGNQLRPHVVWFGESPFNLVESFKAVQNADVFLIIGTSLEVYPAAALIEGISDKCRVIVVDPKKPDQKILSELQMAIERCPVKIIHVVEKATIGVPTVVETLLKGPVA